MTRIIKPLVLLLVLGGCAGTLPPTGALTPICEAVGSPLRYNTYRASSLTYVPPHSTSIIAQMKKKNQVGHNLHCYK